ncbi:MAG: hypothetical protein HQK98_00320 [Nitrospirae bacterium]|nr:hypothetical protein [Nitrospirota bacterium]
MVDKKSKRCKYRLDNAPQKKFCIVEVDGCFITDNDKQKCDYLIINCDSNVAYFVELKGKDIFHAIEQITQSIELLSVKITGCKINARIVLTRVADSVAFLENDPKMQRFEKLLRGYKNGNLKKGTIQFVEPE